MDRYSVFLGDVGGCSDRYCAAYDRPYSTEELFDRVASIEGIGGVDLVVNAGFHNRESEIGGHLARTGLAAVSLNPDLFSDPEFRQGSYSSVSASTRKKALDLSLRSVDAARSYGCPLVVLWPGQDGYDYIFQSDYIAERKRFTDAIREICRYAPEITIGLEYKPKEPRTRSYLSTAAVALLIIQEVGENNCAVTLDYGHALYAYENPAESVALLAAHGNRLAHVHMNDNYRSWDDDMIVGTVHTLEYLEFFYWLGRTGYDGWLTIDQFPYREDGRDAVAESVRWMQKLRGALKRTDLSAIERVLASKDAVASSRLMRSILFP